MGGTLSLLGATTGEFVVGIPFYGSIAQEVKDSLNKIKAPILGIYGTHDHGITVESVREFKAKLDEQGTPNEFHFYEADHAFFNDTRDSYDKEAAEDAWERLKAWLEKYLQS